MLSDIRVDIQKKEDLRCGRRGYPDYHPSKKKMILEYDIKPEKI